MSNVKEFKNAEEISQELINDALAAWNEAQRTDIEASQVVGMVVMEYRVDGLHYHFVGGLCEEDVYCDLAGLQADLLDERRGIDHE